MNRVLKLLAVLGLLLSPTLAVAQTQCVTNARAGGTANAITVPLLPCGLATNVLILTLSAQNSSTTVTLQMAGFPAQPVKRSDGTALQVGDLSGANAVVLLTSTGSSWLLFNTSSNLGGILSVANGGTGNSSLAANGIIYGNGTSPVGLVAAGTTGQYLKGATGSPPLWGNVTDFAAAGLATTFTAKQTFSGTSSNLAAALVNSAEPSTIAATAATGTINYDVCTQSVLYYTSAAAANWTENLRCSAGTALNSVMNTGDTVTVTHLVAQGGTAFFNNVVTVDGVGITPKWQGGAAPAAGNINSTDIYSYAIVKTGNAAFTVFASQVTFK